MKASNKAEMRRFPRFKVSDLNTLKARIDKGRDQEKIITLGQGGCGFYGFDPKWPFNPQKRLFCEIEFEGLDEPLTLESSIVYMKPVTLDHKKVIFYGIEFLPFEQLRVLKVIESLEKLRSKGEVDLA